jgi:hypothetical protein
VKVLVGVRVGGKVLVAVNVRVGVLVIVAVGAMRVYESVSGQLRLPKVKLTVTVNVPEIPRLSGA